MQDWQKMTLQTYDEDYVNALYDLFVKFWYNTVFNQGYDGSVVIDYDDFNSLSQICIDIERGQYEHSVGE